MLIQVMKPGHNSAKEKSTNNLKSKSQIEHFPELNQNSDE